MRALHTAATGMMAQELNVQVISNNIANMRTTGYKRQRAEFQDLLYEHVRRVGAQTSDQGNILPVGIDLGGGVKTVGTPRLMTQGTLSPDRQRPRRRHPRRRLLQDPDARRHLAYTRDGSFQMDAQGRIVTAQGNPVQPTITIPQNSSGLTINAQGQVSVTPQGSTTPTVLGQFQLTRFVNKAGLQAIGDNLFTETPASGTPQDGTAQHRRRRRHAAGQSRTGQCRGGDRDLRSDRRAARLRDERQGHHRRRPDAVGHLQHDALVHDPEKWEPVFGQDHAQANHEGNSMIRTLTAALAGLVALGATCAAAPEQERPVLKAEATVTGDIVRIGDLVEHAGIVAKVPIFRAPDLGSTGTVPADAVIEAVRNHALIGLDTGGVSEVVVTRASRTIPPRTSRSASRRRCRRNTRSARARTSW